MMAIKLFVFTVMCVSALSARAAGGDRADPKPAAEALAKGQATKLPPIGSLDFSERLAAAEHDLMVLDNRVYDAEGSLRTVQGENARFKARYGMLEPAMIQKEKQAAAAVVEAKGALHERFGEGIEKIRDQMWATRYRAQDIRRYGIGNEGALKIAEQENKKFTEEFLSRWKGKVPKRLGRMGALGLAAAAVPLAIDAMNGSRAEANELTPADLTAPEAAETERTPVEISATLDDN